uniref:C-type lectin domain family 4 member F-like n=1 Tax=Phascolarctos cinereus TaxID=38626 RepID=A0A6P5LJT9_PHACI|nr:C-type lectin domain family 4 member F-like [Phascolarctos cinereus]
MLKEDLKNANTLASQIQTLTKELAKANDEIQRLKPLLQRASQILGLRSDLNKVNVEIQKAGGSTLNDEILKLKSQLETVTQQQQMVQERFLRLIIQGWHFYEGNAYYLSITKKSWDEAEEFCVSHDSHLASVTSEEEQEFLVKATNGVYHWIGLTDKGTEGIWHWVDGTPYNSAKSKGFWNKKQPDNWNHGNGIQEDCVHSMEKWNDMICQAPYPWICKKVLYPTRGFNLFPTLIPSNLPTKE